MSTAADAAGALAQVVANEPELVLLDVVIADEDGWEVLEELRLVSGVTVVFVTGRGLEMDRVAGLMMAPITT